MNIKVTENAYTFARRQIEANRRQVASKMPNWLKKHREDYRDRLISAAKKSFKETGIWFLARGASRDKDEQETVAVWSDLLTFYELEGLPYYSKENHQQAIEFWRSWQNLKTGRLYNPLYQDPQHPEIKRETSGNRNDYSAESINLKYIPNILDALGSELPMPCHTEYCAEYDEDTKDAFDQLWEAIALWNSSHAGMFPVTAAREVEKGDWDKIPQVEAGMGALIRGYDKKTGLWRPEPLENFPWREYQPSSGFKIISRICGYVGMENFPLEKLKTSIDNLLAHKEELLLEQYPAMPRNYGEMMAHRLMLTDYRHDELLDAMEYCLDGFRDKKLWEKTETSSYSMFGSDLIGVFMNWEDDLPFKKAFRFEHGCKMKYRFVADPYGNWVNVIPKKDEEIFGHSDYDVNKYGMKARNKIHWTKSITDIIPQKELALKNNEGLFKFTLREEQLTVPESLYLKASWNGAYDILLNGHLVKQVRYNLPDVPAGLYIPYGTLRASKNTIEVRLTSPGKDQSPGAPLSKESPFIRLGLINWS